MHNQKKTKKINTHTQKNKDNPHTCTEQTNKQIIAINFLFFANGN